MVKESNYRKEFKCLSFQVSKIYNKKGRVKCPHNILFRFKYAIKNLLPMNIFIFLSKIKQIKDLLINFGYDFIRVYIFSSAIKYPDSRNKLAAKITISYHGIEKGLSLKSTRIGFGKENVEILFKQLKTYIDLYGVDQLVLIATDVLREYLTFNEHNKTNDTYLVNQIKNFIAKIPTDNASLGGTISLQKSDILAFSKIDFINFLKTRHSIRQFSKDNVDMSLLLKAIKMAQYSPSVCNRQSGKVIILSNKNDILKALEIQGGAKGFEEQIDKLIIVLSDMNIFQSVGERYQCWIDGGMFAMTIVYALHSLGIGTCFLNWSKTYDTDLLLKKEMKINNSDTVIVMIATGNLPEQFQVAHSKRKDIETILDIR